MSERTIVLELTFDELMGFYFSAEEPLVDEAVREKIFQAALQLGESWEQFEPYLKTHFYFPAQETFFTAALRFADTHQRCLMICQGVKSGSPVEHEAAEKMATCAQTLGEWQAVELYARRGSDLEAQAERKVAELSDGKAEV